MVEAPQPSADAHARRRKSERDARWAERLAAVHLMLKGYRILAMRYRSPRGEIDIVAVRRRRIAFVEVKQRPSFAQAERAVSPQQARRLAEAAAAWVRRHKRYRSYEQGFDRMEVVGLWRTRHVVDALQPLG